MTTVNSAIASTAARGSRPGIRACDISHRTLRSPACRQGQARRWARCSSAACAVVPPFHHTLQAQRATPATHTHTHRYDAVPRIPSQRGGQPLLLVRALRHRPRQPVALDLRVGAGGRRAQGGGERRRGKDRYVHPLLHTPAARMSLSPAATPRPLICSCRGCSLPLGCPHLVVQPAPVAGPPPDRGLPLWGRARGRPGANTCRGAAVLCCHAPRSTALPPPPCCCWRHPQDRERTCIGRPSSPAASSWRRASSAGPMKIICHAVRGWASRAGSGGQDAADLQAHGRRRGAPPACIATPSRTARAARGAPVPRSRDASDPHRQRHCLFLPLNVRPES